MQLYFQIQNEAGGISAPSVIYVTDSTTYNKVSLQIQLSSGQTQLEPGPIPIPDPSTPPTKGTAIYVDLSALEMTDAVWRQLTLSATDWAFRTFPDQGVFGMTPTKPITFSSGTSGVITVSIGGIEVPQPLATPQVQLYAQYSNVPGVAGSYVPFTVALQRPPDASLNLLEAIALQLNVNGIVNSPTAQLTASNRFALQFSSTSAITPKAGDDTVFTVGFVYGALHDPDGYGALTDTDNATRIQAAKGLNADQWVVTGYTEVQHPYWTLQPPAGAPIVGIGAQSIVEVLFGSIVTTYQPGPTAMLISWTGVPGYRDGAFALVLNKIAHAQIKSLDVSPNPVCFTDGSADVTATWVVFGAQSLALTQNYLTTPVTGKTELPVKLQAESTVLTLKATGAPGTVENVDYKDVTAIALPVINSFLGTPTEIFSGSSSHSATFAWAVDTSDGIVLNSTGGAFHSQPGGATGSAPTTILRPQMVTLAPVTAADPLTLTRNLVISAFTPTPQSYSQAASAVAVSPTGPFLLVGDGSSVTALDTVAFRPTATVPTGKSASAIAFSADGCMVAAANDDPSLSLFSSSVDSSGRPSFGTPQTLQLKAIPHALVFSPDAKRLFVTVDGATGKPGQVVAYLKGEQGYALESAVAVGVGPRGLTFDAAGARLFVANSGDDTMSVIGLTVAGRLGNVTSHAVAGGPTGIAAAPGGQQLLVSCVTKNAVVSIDPNHIDTGQRTTLTVGKAPGQLAVTPNGAYAFVVNTGDGTLSLIDCSGLPSTAEVLGEPIAVGAQPTGIAVSADGLQVPVATGAGLTVVTLATYAATDSAASIPLQPTSVEVSADGSSAFVWHDASIPVVGDVPGIIVYDTTTTNTTEVMADKYVLRCVTSGDPLQKLAVAIVKGDPSLYLIDEQLDVTEVGLTLPTAAVPVSLAISTDGSTIWVVVSDPSGMLSLVVLQASPPDHAALWKQVLTLPLYSAGKQGRQLLRATLDGTMLFLLDTVAATVHVILRSGRGYVLSPTVIKSGTGALDLAVLPDASAAYVLTAGPGGESITVIDLPALTSRVVAIPETYVAMRALRPSPDGRRLFATDSSAGALRVLDPVSLRILQTIPLAADRSTVSGALGLAVAADGSAIYAASITSQTLATVEQIQMGLGQQASERHGSLRATGRLTDESSALFMRHALDDSPTTPTNGWSASPDVIPYGTAIAPDLTQFITPAGYAKDFVANVQMQNPNYVYVRGLNTTSAQISSRVYFYYTKGSLAMWPSNWTKAFVQVNGQDQNWVDVIAPPVSSTSNGVGVGQVPLVWTPPLLDPGADHYCVIGWVVNGPDPQPPDFSKYAGFTTFDQLVSFIMAHHNVAWRNTVDVISQPPNSTYSTLLPIQAGGAQVFLTISFPNVPLDATFSVNLQGNQPDNTLALENASVGDYQGGYSPLNNPLPFPPEAFQTSLQVSLYQGKTPIPDTGRVKIVMSTPVPPSLLREITRVYSSRGLRSPLRTIGGIPQFLVGSTTYKLLFNGPHAASLKESGR